jgi:hypothetical protein
MLDNISILIYIFQMKVKYISKYQINDNIISMLYISMHDTENS